MDEEQIAVPTDPIAEVIPEPIAEEAPAPTLPDPPVIEEPVSEPVPLEPVAAEPVPEQINEHAAAPVTEPEKPIEVPEEPEPVQPKPEPVPVPALPEAPEPEPSKPFDVNSLSDEQLKAAAALYTKRNQAEISRKGVAKRKETMELNLRTITDYLSRNNGSPLPRIAKNANITPGTTSKYLRQLIASDKVKAEGWGKTRRYFLKRS